MSLQVMSDCRNAVIQAAKFMKNHKSAPLNERKARFHKASRLFHCDVRHEDGEFYQITKILQIPVKIVIVAVIDILFRYLEFKPIYCLPKYVSRSSVYYFRKCTKWYVLCL